MEGWTDLWMDVSIYGLIDEPMDGWMDLYGWMDGMDRMDGSIHGSMGGWMVGVKYVVIYSSIYL